MILERAYNICSDLSLVAATLVGGGLEAVEAMEVRAGNPVRPMLAQRLSEPDEILCFGRDVRGRVQVRRHPGPGPPPPRMASATTVQFPQLVELLGEALGPREAILEGEVVAFDPASGELRPFQDVMFGAASTASPRRCATSPSACSASSCCMPTAPT